MQCFFGIMSEVCSYGFRRGNFTGQVSHSQAFSLWNSLTMITVWKVCVITKEKKISTFLFSFLKEMNTLLNNRISIHLPFYIAVSTYKGVIGLSINYYLCDVPLRAVIIHIRNTECNSNSFHSKLDWSIAAHP